jgi:hypothetical protein
LIVTPLMLRAVTSSPNGKCRSIFLIGGLQSSFFSQSLSSIVDGEVLIFLKSLSAGAHTTAAAEDRVRICRSARTYQFNFWVSGAILSSTFSFSLIHVNRAPSSSLRRLTKIIDVEDAADGTARPPVLRLRLRRRSRCVVDSRVNLAKGARILDFSGHCDDEIRSLRATGGFGECLKCSCSSQVHNSRTAGRERRGEGSWATVVLWKLRAVAQPRLRQLMRALRKGQLS